MFSIYGLTGPTFRGTLEDLKRSPIPAVRGVRAVAPIGDPALLAAQAAAQAGATPELAARTPLGERAVTAYRQALHLDQERGPLYHAGQIMRREVVTVAAAADVAQAWHVLLDKRIHQAPVLDAQGALVGIVSERNLLTALNVDQGQVRDVLARRVADVMASPVVAAAPVTDIRRIAMVMLDYDVDGVPIVDDAGALVGFISRSDILRAVITDPPLSLWR